jgi:hypothetical protein
MNESIREKFHNIAKAEFGAMYRIVVGIDVKAMDGDCVIRIGEESVHASSSSPAIVIRIKDDSQDMFACLDSESLCIATERLRGFMRTTWDARLSLPYDAAIRGVEVSLPCASGLPDIGLCTLVTPPLRHPRRPNLRMRSRERHEVRGVVGQTRNEDPRSTECRVGVGRVVRCRMDEVVDGW